MNGDYFTMNDQQQQAGSSSSRSRRNNNMYVVPTENGVIRSNLTPTAREFTPSGVYVPLDGGDKSRGAIRKQSSTGSFNKGGSGGGGGGGGSSRQFTYDRHRENKYSSNNERQPEQDSQNRNDYNGYGRNNNFYRRGGGRGRKYNGHYGKNRNGDIKGGEVAKTDNWRRADAKSNEKNTNGASRMTKKNCKLFLWNLKCPY